MSVRLSCWTSALLVSLFLCSAAVAVVVQVRVTRASIKQDPKAFSIEAEARPDGLVHFTITRGMPAERYVVAELTIRNGPTLIARSSVPAFVRERSATYYVSIAPDYLADSTLELSDRTFSDNKPNPLPLPGGTDFVISLKDFAPAAPLSPIR